MWLVCSANCGSTLYRTKFAEVDVDSSGGYLDHRVLQPSYICLGCGAPALDLGAVPEAMREEAEEDAPAASIEVLCPVCETIVTVRVGEDCPNCGSEMEFPAPAQDQR